MTGKRHDEPWAARLHPFARAIRPAQETLVALLRGNVERSPHWVLLTTRGRKTGLPREVLLPCARKGRRVLVISTYGRRSAWIRNLEACPEVQLTARGKTVTGRAEIVDDVARKHALVAEMPFLPLAPVGLAQSLARGLLRGPAVAWLKTWVTPRPVVLIEITSDAPAAPVGAPRRTPGGREGRREGDDGRCGPSSSSGRPRGDAAPPRSRCR